MIEKQEILTLEEKYNICLKLKQFDRAKKLLLEIKQIEQGETK